MSFDINTVEEIHVKYTHESGMKDVIYRGKGLEKFRRLLNASPAYGIQEPLVIDEYSESEEEDPKPKKKSSKKSSKKNAPASNGYAQANLNYDSTATKGKNPVDLAREMQKQAEASLGVNF